VSTDFVYLFDLFAAKSVNFFCLESGNSVLQLMVVVVVVVVCSCCIVDHWMIFDSGHYRWQSGRTTHSKRMSSSVLSTSPCHLSTGPDLTTRRGTGCRHSTSWRLYEHIIHITVSSVFDIIDINWIVIIATKLWSSDTARRKP